MKAWRSSPYGAIAIYASGDLRACSQRLLTDEWVREVSGMGWKIIPIDVGLQAPCAYNERLGTMSSSTSVARDQGVRAAEGAVRAAGALGLLPGSALYADLEPFRYAIPGCTEAVRSYLSGWTESLHKRGYLAGAYGDTSIARTQSVGFDSAEHRLDAVWSARWDGVAETEGWSDLSDDRWSTHQRVKQFRGDHDEVHGGAVINIDSNIVDAPVATVAQPHEVPELSVPRARPDPFAGLAGVPVAPGWTAPLVCRAETASGVWSKLADGTYLPLKATPTASAADLPVCTMPFQVTGKGRVRSAPDAAADVHGVLPTGSLTWATCETPGITRGQPGFWQRTADGGWVAGPRTNKPDPYAHHPALPLC